MLPSFRSFIVVSEKHPTDRLKPSGKLDTTTNPSGFFSPTSETILLHTTASRHTRSAMIFVHTAGD